MPIVIIFLVFFSGCPPMTPIYEMVQENAKNIQNVKYGMTPDDVVSIMNRPYNDRIQYTNGTAWFYRTRADTYRPLDDAEFTPILFSREGKVVGIGYGDLARIGGQRETLGPPPPLRQLVSVPEDDQYDPHIMIQGIERWYPGHSWNKHFLRTVIHKETGITSHVLYIANNFIGSRSPNWYRVHDKDTQSLELNVVDSQYFQHLMLYTTDMVVSIPTRQLRTHQDGYSMKVYGKGGDTLTINIDSEQIAKQLSATSIYTDARILQSTHGE